MSAPDDRLLPSEGDPERAARLAAVLEEWLARAGEGDAPRIETVVTAHPDLAPDLRDALESLDYLSRESAGTAPTPSSPTPSFSPEGDREPVERRLGDFRILREVGRGGMGVVYEARQESLGRRVALKVLPFAAVLDAKQLQRFRNEALAAAQLHHTHIVPVHSVGCERGVHYYSMQFIEGESLARAIAELRRARSAGTAGPAEASPAASSPVSSHGSTSDASWFRLVARLGLEAAEALAYAHQVGVVHRDVKPANLLVDSAGSLWITDFGLARFATDGDLTATGDLLGTLRYMSPEQARRLPADHRTDVYSLGATLYELASLEPAFPGHDAKSVLAAVSDAEPVPLRRLRPSVPIDLETVIGKAMSKEPSHRYATAGEMADDLRRFLEDRPVLARRPTWRRRAGKWARRHRALVTSAAVAGVLLLAGLAIGAVLVLREQAKTRRALDDATAERAAADEARDRARARGLVNASTYARAFDPNLSLLLAREAVGTARTAETSRALREALGAALERVRIPGDRAPMALARFSPRGDFVLTVGTYSVARVWDAKGKPVAILPGGGNPAPAAWSPREDTVLATSPHGARLWTREGKLLATVADVAPDSEVLVFSPAGDRFAAAARDGATRVWDLGGRVVATLEDSKGARSASFVGADGRVLLVTGDGRARLFDVAGRPTATLGAAGVLSAVASPAGDRIATVGERGAASVWDEKGAEVAHLLGHESAIRHVEFDSAGDRIVTASDDRTARVWTAGAAPVCVCRGHLGAVAWASFSPAGDAIVTASADGTARVWDLAGFETAALRGHTQAVSSAVFSPAGDRVVTASLDRTARIWDVAPPEPVRLLGHRGGIAWAAFSPDGERVLTASADGTARLFDRGGAERAALVGHEGAVRAAAFSPSGARMVTASADKTARVWDRDGRVVAVLRGHAGAVGCAAISGDERVATGSEDGVARLWSARGEETAVLRGHAGEVTAVAFLEGARCVTASADATLRIWEPDGTCTSVLRGHHLPARAISVAPSGRLFVTTAKDGAARLWDDRGGALAILRGHDGAVTDAEFSPDGRWILTASEDRTAKRWAADGTEAATFRGHAGAVRTAGFSPAGDRVVTTSDDGTVRVWDLDGHPLDVLTPRGGALAAAISPDGGAILVNQGAAGCALWRARLADLIPLAEARTVGELTRAQRAEHRDLLGAENEVVLRAHDVVDALFRDRIVSVAVVEAIREDAALPADVRAHALRIAQARRDDADLLNREAWSIVIQSAAERFEYERGLRIAKAVVRIAPDDADALNTLGTAQYRLGLYDDAVRTLTRCEEVRVRAGRPPAAEDLAVLAMAHHRAGRAEKARLELARLRALLADPAVARLAGPRGFLAEAEAVLAGPAEKPAN